MYGYFKFQFIIEYQLIFDLLLFRGNFYLVGKQILYFIILFINFENNDENFL